MASSDSDPVLQKKASVMTLDEVINAGDEEAPKLLTEEPAAVEATITTDLLGDEAPKDKKSFGKRPVKSALIHLGIWLVMTAYIVAFGILGKGKAGYEFGMLVYVFISLRLLAQHVSMSNLIYGEQIF
ncbi:hypothetical protein BJ742DRAFT_177399 [Cladochytrium replicatum]|nr:hypothetical protein BJ742DRAFT_177399 [Cladochytrium replicatum]